MLKLVGLVSLSSLGRDAVKATFRKSGPVLVPPVVREQPFLSYTGCSFAMDCAQQVHGCVHL